MTHIPQVPGQFTEGDEGLPEEWKRAFAETKQVAIAMKVLGITSLQTCPKCNQLWANLNDRNCRKCGAAMVTVEALDDSRRIIIALRSYLAKQPNFDPYVLQELNRLFKLATEGQC